MIGEDGGAEEAVTNRINRGWGKFNMLAPLLCSVSVSDSVKARLYAACVRCCILYSSETWAVTAQNLKD